MNLLLGASQPTKNVMLFQRASERLLFALKRTFTITFITSKPSPAPALRSAALLTSVARLPPESRRPRPAFTLPIEVHGRLLAVLSAVTGGPTVVTREIAALFVTGTVATAHQALSLVHTGRPRHEALHGWDGECGLAPQHGLGGHAATIGRVHYREGAAAILLGAHIATATHWAEGQEGEGEDGRPRERVLEVVGVADCQAAGAAAPAAATRRAHNTTRWWAGGGLLGRWRLLMVVVVMVVLSGSRNVPRGAAAATTAAAVETAFRDRGERRAGAGGRAAGHGGHVWERRGRVATGGGSVAVCTEAALQGAHGHTAHRREGSFGVGCVQSSPGVYYCRGHTDLHVIRTRSLPRNGRIRRDR